MLIKKTLGSQLGPRLFRIYRSWKNLKMRICDVWAGLRYIVISIIADRRCQPGSKSRPFSADLVVNTTYHINSSNCCTSGTCTDTIKICNSLSTTLATSCRSIQLCTMIRTEFFFRGGNKDKPLHNIHDICTIYDILYTLNKFLSYSHACLSSGITS